MNYQWIPPHQVPSMTTPTASYGPLPPATSLTAPSAPYGSMPTLQFQVRQLQPHMTHPPIHYTSTLPPTSLTPQLGPMPTAHIVQLQPTIPSIPTSTHPIPSPDPNSTWGSPAMLVTPPSHSHIWPQAIPAQAANENNANVSPYLYFGQIKNHRLCSALYFSPPHQSAPRVITTQQPTGSFSRGFFPQLFAVNVSFYACLPSYSAAPIMSADAAPMDGATSPSPASHAAADPIGPQRGTWSMPPQPTSPTEQTYSEEEDGFSATCLGHTAKTLNLGTNGALDGLVTKNFGSFANGLILAT